jgi:AraC-like DNA-binding protein
MSISSTVVEGAEIRFHTAAPALQPYVGCFWVITAECGATIRIVPDGTTSISIEQPKNGDAAGYLRGPLLHPIELRFTAPAALVGVRLRPGVAFLLSGVVAHSMVDRRIRLSDCAAFRDLASIDAMPCASVEMIAVLQEFLIDRLRGASIHPVVTRALDEINRHHGCVPVAEVAARCRASERHLNRLMHDWVGYGPKRYAGIVRFQSTLAQMERAPEWPVSMLASETGYFDQAHLTVDVGRYAGATPGHLRSNRVSDFSKTRCDVPF